MPSFTVPSPFVEQYILFFAVTDLTERKEEFEHHGNEIS
jgi:hypothetical protein